MYINKPRQIRDILGLDSLQHNGQSSAFKKTMRVQIKDQDTLSNLSSTRVSQIHSANVSPRASMDLCAAAEIIHQNYKNSQ